MVKNSIPDCRMLGKCWSNSSMSSQLNKYFAKEYTATWQCSYHNSTISHDLVRWPLGQDRHDSKTLRGHTNRKIFKTSFQLESCLIKNHGISQEAENVQILSSLYELTLGLGNWQGRGRGKGEWDRDMKCVVP